MFSRLIVITSLVLFASLSVGSTSKFVYADGGKIDLNAFRPAMDSRGYVTVNASQVLGHGELSFGLVTSWGSNLLTLEKGDVVHTVSNMLSPTLIAAFGLKLGNAELEFGTSLPFSIVSGDRNPDDDAGTPLNPNDDDNFQYAGQGLGDIGIHLKTRFLNTSKGKRIGVAMVASLYLPTAKDKDRWYSDGLTPQIQAVVDKEFGDTGKLKMAVNVGLRLRLGDHKFVDDIPDTPMTNEVVDVGPSIPFGLGLSYSIIPEKFDLVAELIGDIPLGGENYFPLEANGAIKLYMAANSFLSLGGGLGLIPGAGGNPDFRVFLGIIFEPAIGDRDGDRIKDDVDLCPNEPEDYDGFMDSDGCPEPDNDMDGILDPVDQCPNEPEDKDGIEDEDGCPERDVLDRDGDGIVDEEDGDDGECADDPEDKDGFEDEDGCPDIDNDQDTILDIDDVCPDDPEDHDGWEDEDGCPDPDNDGDRILDVDDKCPNEPEVYNGVNDEDGCPDAGRVVITKTNIEILDKIYFEYDKAIIKRKSYPILNAVAATLIGNPEITLIEIQGHTDERGADNYNLRLSDWRAKAVKAYLEVKGVPKGRLQAQGYGETKPIDKSSNEQAWSKNRRVEFLILKRNKTE